MTEIYVSATREAPGVWRGWFDRNDSGHLNRLRDTHKTKAEAIRAVKERLEIK